MSIEIKINFPCPICKNIQEERITKPNYFNASFVGVTCEGCDTKFRAKFSSLKGGDKRIKIEPYVMEIGARAVPILEAIVAKEKAVAKDIENQINTQIKEKSQNAT